VYVESFATILSLRAIGNLDGWRMHLPAQSPKLNIKDVVTSGISADEFRENGPWEENKQDLNTLEEATELYIVEVIPESSF